MAKEYPVLIRTEEGEINVAWPDEDDSMNIHNFIENMACELVKLNNLYQSRPPLHVLRRQVKVIREVASIQNSWMGQKRKSYKAN